MEIMDEEGAKVVSSSSSIERRSPPLPKAAAPWLVFPYKVKGKKQNQALYNICKPDKRNRRKFILELSGKSYWQKHSHQGWLIVVCDNPKYDYAPNWKFGDCFLWNPASLEMIQLPSLLPWYRKPYSGLVDCVLSSPPRTSTNPDDNAVHEPVVLLLFLRYRSDVDYDFDLVFCHPGDERWRKKCVDGSSLCCVKDKLYLMCRRDDYLEIDKRKLWDNDDNSLILSLFETTNDTLPWRRTQDNTDCRDFYVESSVELFKVHIRFNRSQNMKVFNSVVVLRLDFSSKEWKEVTCLGDNVLFVGLTTRACCSASKLGLTRGCLYYTLREDQGLYKFDVQSSRNSVILPCAKLPKRWLPSNWIMMLEGPGQEDEEEDCTRKEVEKESSVIAYEKNEKDGGFEDIRPWAWRILNAVILACLSCFLSDLKNENEKNGGFEETSPWDILDADSKELVASYLHPLDYVHFRSVCKTIRAMLPVPKPKFATTSITKTSNLFPWLVFCGDRNDTVYNFVVPVHTNEYYLIKFSELLRGATICFQKGGWLLMSREKILFFYNPFTREAINLPHLPEHYISSSICFSSLPTSADCIVFSIDQSQQGTITVYSITRGKQVWDIFNFDNAIRYRPLCNPPVLHHGAFYSVDYDGVLGAFSLEDNSWKVLGTPRKICNDTYAYPSFLVESGEDLLLVKLGHEEKLVRIFKLNFPVMDWVEVESLGKRMLFISHTSCFSVIAPSSRMENKIYFPRLCLNGEGILFYSLDTSTYDSFEGRHSSKNLYETEGWRTNCTWIEPNWSKFTPQELNWVEPPF